MEGDLPTDAQDLLFVQEHLLEEASVDGRAGDNPRAETDDGDEKKGKSPRREKTSPRDDLSAEEEAATPKELGKKTKSKELGKRAKKKKTESTSPRKSKEENKEKKKKKKKTEDGQQRSEDISPRKSKEENKEKKKKTEDGQQRSEDTSPRKNKEDNKEKKRGLRLSRRDSKKRKRARKKRPLEPASISTRTRSRGSRG